MASVFMLGLDLVLLEPKNHHKLQELVLDIIHNGDQLLDPLSHQILKRQGHTNIYQPGFILSEHLNDRCNPFARSLTAFRVRQQGLDLFQGFRHGCPIPLDLISQSHDLMCSLFGHPGKLGQKIFGLWQLIGGARHRGLHITNRPRGGLDILR